MHKSIFYMLNLDNSNEFSLNKETSEWLFSIGFWDNVNQKSGMNFDQFEEDEVDIETLEKVNILLEETIDIVKDNSDKEIVFIQGWDNDDKELSVSISKEKLLLDLLNLKELIVYAVEHKNKMIFDL